ncbi:hypothetical protein BB561_003685 [Smittium simulii]|uniref:Uncharacterized protein n=1 Tax=Smittium simulii TaxID=133385 RepID=A0A2T9YJZ8_9FUNG|nr:hypothetical protein BB561_003685 [Smittium simulii]
MAENNLEDQQELIFETALSNDSYAQNLISDTLAEAPVVKKKEARLDLLPKPTKISAIESDKHNIPEIPTRKDSKNSNPELSEAIDQLQQGLDKPDTKAIHNLPLELDSSNEDLEYLISKVSLNIDSNNSQTANNTFNHLHLLSTDNDVSNVLKTNTSIDSTLLNPLNSSTESVNTDLQQKSTNNHNKTPLDDTNIEDTPNNTPLVDTNIEDTPNNTPLDDTNIEDTPNNTPLVDKNIENVSTLNQMQSNLDQIQKSDTISKNIPLNTKIESETKSFTQNIIESIQPDNPTTVTPRLQVYGSTISGNRTYKSQIKQSFNILKTHEIEFEFLCIAADSKAKSYMKRKALGNMTVPQFYVDKEFVGLFDDFYEANEADCLVEWLGLDEEPLDF